MDGGDEEREQQGETTLFSLTLVRMNMVRPKDKILERKRERERERENVQRFPPLRLILF